MDRTWLAAIVIAFLFVLLGLMVFGWQRRQRRQADVVAPQPAPDSLGTILGSFVGKYVATTRAGDPLDRIAVHGLGFRGSIEVTVSDVGLLLERAGSPAIWIPRSDVRDMRRATWTIDRVVEPDGMHLVEWTLGDTIVDTYLRMDDGAAFDGALSSLTEGKRS
ncbi:hypothetical protein BH10ACT7_BH10ACT7_01390 [soil metagenome]